VSVTLGQNHNDIANLFWHQTTHSELELELKELTVLHLCLPLSLPQCLPLFFLLVSLGATLKVAGCQVSHAFASFSFLSTATFFLFMAPAMRFELQIEVVNSLLSLAVCQLAGTVNCRCCCCCCCCCYCCCLCGKIEIVALTSA